MPAANTHQLHQLMNVNHDKTHGGRDQGKGDGWLIFYLWTWTWKISELCLLLAVDCVCSFVANVWMKDWLDLTDFNLSASHDIDVMAGSKVV